MHSKETAAELGRIRITAKYCWFTFTGINLVLAALGAAIGKNPNLPPLESQLHLYAFSGLCLVILVVWLFLRNKWQQKNSLDAASTAPPPPGVFEYRQMFTQAVILWVLAQFVTMWGFALGIMGVPMEIWLGFPAISLFMLALSRPHF